MRHACAGACEPRDVALREVDAVGAPDVVGQPAQPVEVLHGTTAVQLEAVRILFDCLRQVRVQGQAEAAGERSRFLHQATGDREGGARRHRQLDTRARAGLVEEVGKPFGLGEHGIELLDQFVRRKTPVRDPEIHGATRGDDSHPDLARRLHLGLDQAVAAAREDVVVIEDGRAAGERELREACACGGVLGLGIDPRPDRVELAQPGEEVGFLGPGAGEGLVEVVVSVDEAGCDDRTVQVDAGCRLGLDTGADPGDRGAVYEEPAALVLGAGVVHRDDDAVRVERRHAEPGCDSRSPASVWRMKLAFSQNSVIDAAST